MKFYTLSIDYAEFLKKFDSKVPNLTGVDYKNPKPFVGVVLEIDGHKYLAPMTSPKSWHDDIKNSNVNYFKIHENGDPTNYLGMINFKFMIPIIESEICLIDLDGISSEKYKNLLYNQLQFIRSSEDKIKKRSRLLRNWSLEGKVTGTCDFLALEANYNSYVKP